jgi:hypothetical protein
MVLETARAVVAFAAITCADHASIAMAVQILIFWQDGHHKLAFFPERFPAGPIV